MQKLVCTAAVLKFTASFLNLSEPQRLQWTKSTGFCYKGRQKKKKERFLLTDKYEI